MTTLNADSTTDLRSRESGGKQLLKRSQSAVSFNTIMKSEKKSASLPRLSGGGILKKLTKMASTNDHLSQHVREIAIHQLFSTVVPQAVIDGIF